MSARGCISPAFTRLLLFIIYQYIQSPMLHYAFHYKGFFYLELALPSFSLLISISLSSLLLQCSRLSSVFTVLSCKGMVLSVEYSWERATGKVSRGLVPPRCHCCCPRVEKVFRNKQTEASSWEEETQIKQTADWEHVSGHTPWAVQSLLELLYFSRWIMNGFSD